MKKFPIKLIGQILAIIIAIIIAWAWNHTTLFVSTKSAPTNYLPIDDYFLVDTETGKKPSLNSLNFESQYAYINSNYETTFGFKPGDSFEKLVELYGDYYVDMITVSQEKDGETFYDYVDGPILLRDFYNDSVVKGPYDLKNTNIDVTFRVYVSGNKIYYTPEEQLDAMRQYYDNSFWIGYNTFSFTKPKIQCVALSFYYAYPGVLESLKDGGIFDFSTYRYTY